MSNLIRSAAERVITKESTLWKNLRDLYYRLHHLPEDRLVDIYRWSTKNSIFFREREILMCSLNAEKKLNKAIELFSPRSVLDLGCGTGRSLDFFLDHGIDAYGVEGSSLAISKARHPERIHLWNLNETLNLSRTFDLAWCYEVIEHIHPRFVANLMQTFCNHSDRIILSAAPPGQKGEGHFNEQPLSYWREQFERYGYSCDEEATTSIHEIDEYFSKNMLVVERI